MKRAAFSLLSLALGLSLYGALDPVDRRHSSQPVARYTAVATGAIGRAFKDIAPTTKAARDDERDIAEIRKRVRSGEAGTYIADILRLRDSSLARWPDRRGVPLKVWVQPASRVADFTPEYVDRAREAFLEWDDLRLPVRFAFAKDSASADVHVNWIDHFNEPISGRTRWARDDDWAITDANITLAVHHHQGDVLDTESMRAMALHEVGHLLGLDHTTDNSSIMAPRVRVRDLSEADKATVRLIYALPAGPLKGPGS
jgi:predicted Zn-dependent protease